MITKVVSNLEVVLRLLIGFRSSAPEFDPVELGTDGSAILTLE